MSVIQRENAELPNNLTIAKFAAARSREIQVLNKNINTSTAIKLAFQKLPRHMRRRAMSHNVKRLPRRLREIHLSQMKKSGLPPKVKRPSRKYRRRPYNLSTEYMRRQRKIVWLNTHIWHAKRFHTVEKWGYKIPYSPCDKAFRACYRATVRHSLVQDISYYNCLEFTGDCSDIINMFQKITQQRVGLGIGAKAYIGGLREGNTIIFTPGSHRTVGLVYFHWKPKANPNDEDDIRSIWIWCHAALYKELLDIFVNFFGFTLSPNLENKTKYFNGKITLIINKWDLSRFRLTGPLSNAILKNAFKLATYEDTHPDWVKNYFKASYSEPFCGSHEYWEQLTSASSPSEVSPHIILPLIVCDPRYNFPKQRTKSMLNKTSNGSDIALCRNFAHSPLWDEKVRKETTLNKIPTATLNELRHNLLVPGSDLLKPPALFPIILIQRPGKKFLECRGYGSGWDIILPSSWAQPTWLALIMWGGRAGGLRETELITFESGHQHILYPDSNAGEEEEKQISQKCKERFFKLPVNKRTNFARFRIASPFDWNWRMLLTEWSAACKVVTEFSVLRDKRLLRTIAEVLSKKSKERIQIPENCLVPVEITLLKKGTCHKFAVICIPQPQDFEKEPTEPKCCDVYEKERKLMRKEHKQLLKRLRRKRRREKKKGKIIQIDREVLKNYTNNMRKLWLPEPTLIRRSCTREVMGFVKHGNFSFLIGKSKAVGYVTSGALLKLLSMKFSNRILVRNTNSKQYRLGVLNVICE